MGRPAKPIPLKILQGNPGRRRLPKGLAPEPAAAPTAAPAHLSPHAAELWARYAPILATRGCFTVLDTLKFERAIRMIALADGYLELCEAPPCKGRKRKVHPAWSPAMKLLEKGMTILGLFGLSPAERAKLHIPPPDGHEDPISAYRRQRPPARPS